MSTSMIQMRNVPEGIHRQAKARAALAGLSLSDFALRALERELRRPTAAELAARVRSLPPVPEAPAGAALVRQARKTSGDEPREGPDSHPPESGSGSEEGAAGRRRGR